MKPANVEVKGNEVMAKNVRILMAVLLAVGMLGLDCSMVLADSKADARRGERTYQSFCTPCHGQQGDGRGPRAKNEGLQPPPRDHTNGFYMNMQADVRFFKVIKFGGAANYLSPIMPQWKHILSDKKIREIITYLRTLATNPVYTPPATENWGKNPYADEERQGLDAFQKEQKKNKNKK